MKRADALIRGLLSAPRHHAAPAGGLPGAVACLRRLARELPDTRSDTVARTIPAIGGAQRGQALIEAVLVVSTLALLWVAIAWFGRLQDLALQAQHASAHAAFAATRNPEAMGHAATRWHDFLPDQRFHSGDGNAAFADESGVTLRTWRAAALGMQQQVGGASADARAMRDDWQMQDQGALLSQVSVTPPGGRLAETHSGALGSLGKFGGFPTLHRHTAILTGGGESDGDHQAQQRVAGSNAAWASAASASYSLSSRIDAVMASVDRAWSRPRPQQDWLQRWTGHVPPRHLGQLEARHVP